MIGTFTHLPLVVPAHAFCPYFLSLLSFALTYVAGLARMPFHHGAVWSASFDRDGAPFRTAHAPRRSLQVGPAKNLSSFQPVARALSPSNPSAAAMAIP